MYRGASLFSSELLLPVENDLAPATKEGEEPSPIRENRLHPLFRAGVWDVWVLLMEETELMPLAFMTRGRGRRNNGVGEPIRRGEEDLKIK